MYAKSSLDLPILRVNRMFDDSFRDSDCHQMPPVSTVSSALVLTAVLTKFRPEEYAGSRTTGSSSCSSGRKFRVRSLRSTRHIPGLTISPPWDELVPMEATGWTEPPRAGGMTTTHTLDFRCAACPAPTVVARPCVASRTAERTRRPVWGAMNIPACSSPPTRTASKNRDPPIPTRHIPEAGSLCLLLWTLSGEVSKVSGSPPTSSPRDLLQTAGLGFVVTTCIADPERRGACWIERGPGSSTQERVILPVYGTHPRRERP